MSARPHYLRSYTPAAPITMPMIYPPASRGEVGEPASDFDPHSLFVEEAEADPDPLWWDSKRASRAIAIALAVAIGVLVWLLVTKQ